MMMMMILFLCLVLFITILFFKNKMTRKKGKPLPSPPRFPLIGNLHQLGQHPHQTLCYLSYHYGPLMLLYFGSIPVIVASTADAAREVLKMHDRELASRPRSKIYEKLLYNGRNTASVGEYWRQLKSVNVLPSYLLQQQNDMFLSRHKRKRVSSLSSLRNKLETLRYKNMCGWWWWGNEMGKNFENKYIKKVCNCDGTTSSSQALGWNYNAYDYDIPLSDSCPIFLWDGKISNICMNL